MKRVMMIIVLACLLVAGCSEQTIQPRIALTFLGGTNAENLDDLDEGRSESGEYILRAGVELGKLEAGLATHYLVAQNEEIQTYGAYIKQTLTDPNGIWLLGKPYLGAITTLDLDENGGMYGFIVGSSNTIERIEILTEFRVAAYNDAVKLLYGEKMDRYKLFIGPRWRF